MKHILTFLLFVLFVCIDGHAQSFNEYLKAAQNGDAEAQYNLAVCYYNGDEVGKDLVQSAKWWLKSAEQGYADSQYWIAYCYLNELGIVKDEKKAFEWFLKSAKYGNKGR